MIFSKHINSIRRLGLLGKLPFTYLGDLMIQGLVTGRCFESLIQKI